jgi:hypothetical protein
MSRAVKRKPTTTSEYTSGKNRFYFVDYEKSKK